MTQIKTQIFQKFNLIALLLGLFLFYPQISFAFQEVEINEINYTGYTIWSDDTVTDANDEFIELKNPSNNPIVLTGWSLRIVSGAGDKIIPLTGNITDYLVIRKITAAQSGLIPFDKVINVTATNFGSLSNTAGTYIELRNDKNITIDSVNFAGKWPATTKQGESLHKITNFSWEIKPLSPLNIIPIVPPAPPKVYEGVIISEIYPNPAEGKKEFVELYNITDKDIDITGWKLDDIPNGGSAIQILAGIIPAKGFLLLEDGNGLSIILNNDADSVILYDPNNTIQSQIDYTAKVSDKGLSFMLVDNNWIWNTIPSPNAINIAPIIIPPTPTPNPVVTPNPTPIKPPLPKYTIGSIIISELYPYPLEGGEFIELYNTTDTDIDMSDWKISDLVKTYTLSGIIPARGYRVWNQNDTKITLNNTTETVTLADTYGQIQSTVSYDKAKKGLSYIPILQGWGWTQSITPNAPNIFTEEVMVNTLIYRFIESFDILPQIEDDELLELEGQVIIPPGKLSATSFYIMNNQRIIRVYDRQKRFPILKEGDIVRIKAEWHNTDTQQYLKTMAQDDIIVSENKKIDIQVQNRKNVDNTDWGKIVRISGVLDTNTKTKLVLTNKQFTTPIKLFADKVIRPKMKKGDGVTVTGFTEVYDGEIRLIPWNNSQIRAIPSVKVTQISDIQQDMTIISNTANMNTKQSEYQSLDSFQLPGDAQLVKGVENTEWYKIVTHWVENNIVFSTAILLNIIWWGYLSLKRS